MDIYAVEKQAGCYLANELEKLRRKRSNSRVVVKCSPIPINNAKINRFRKSFLLDCGIADMFASADQYCMVINNRAVTFILIYDVCHIIYNLREEIDWKFIELEIIDVKLCQDIVPNKAIIAGRAETIAFQVLVRQSIIYGFQKSFRPQSDTFLYDIFDKIANADELKKADFELESKIASFINKMT